ncbi:MAG: PEP-CTERM sorting domain-containing protein [Planctomycetes bacterium]|nr:PEP-CTERM sorting domain-containing protein [Planctomycetota bacterium]
MKGRLAIGLTCLMALGLSAAPACAELLPAGEDVSGTGYTPQYEHGEHTYGPYWWEYSYFRYFDGEQVTKDIQIDFVFHIEEMSAEDEQQWGLDAEAAIEARWNGRYQIRDNTTTMAYPVGVDVTLDGPFDQTVDVWAEGEGPAGSADPGRTNMSNWHADDSDSIVSHEFGHMMGLYDEYWGGAIDDPEDPTIEVAALMGLGALNENPEMPPRYYEQFFEFICALDPQGDYSLEAAPVVVAGDTDRDSDVDATDLARLAVNWSPGGTSGTWSRGDFDDDADIDAIDLASLGLNWSPSGYAVPEPATGALLLAGALTAVLRKKTFRRLIDEPFASRIGWWCGTG